MKSGTRGRPPIQVTPDTKKKISEAAELEKRRRAIEVQLGRLSEERNTLIREAVGDGAPSTQIADTIGMSQSQVYRIAHD